MEGLLSKVRPKATGFEQPGTSTHTIIFSPCKTETGLVNVHHSSHGEHAPPIITIKGASGAGTCQSKGPDYQFFQGDQVMGEAGYSMSSGKMTMSLRGSPFQMKQSQMTGNFSVDMPPLPPLKWKPNRLTGGSLQLCDATGAKLARMGKSSMLGGAYGGQKLELFVPCDDFFVDLCVVSGYAAWVLNTATNEVIKEVVKAVAGVS